MDILSRIAERKIQEAMKDGEFKELSGSGKPLAYEDESWIPEDLRVAYRFLKNAGYIPHELCLRKEIFNLQCLMESIDDETVRLEKMRELNFTIMHLNMIRMRPFNLGDFPEYENKIKEKIIASQERVS